MILSSLCILLLWKHLHSRTRENFQLVLYWKIIVHLSLLGWVAIKRLHLCRSLQQCGLKKLHLWGLSRKASRSTMDVLCKPNLPKWYYNIWIEDTPHCFVSWRTCISIQPIIHQLRLHFVGWGNDLSFDINGISL